MNLSELTEFVGEYTFSDDRKYRVYIETVEHIVAQVAGKTAKRAAQKAMKKYTHTLMLQCMDCQFKSDPVPIELDYIKKLIGFELAKKL